MYTVSLKPTNIREMREMSISLIVLKELLCLFH